MKRRTIKRGEALAIMPEAVHAGPDAMWWDFWTPIPENGRCGDVAIVHVRGSLDHHRGYGCDSYEEIVDRVRSALSGEDVVDVAKRKNASEYWKDEDEREPIPDASPPSAVVLRIDSPGGVVSGLNEAVFTIQKLARESGIHLAAYVDELAASAAYAIACSCDEIVMPPSAIVGSVGVISTLYDQTEADKEAGLRFVTITSGERKADGHPHVTISDEALAAEQSRVNDLARQFYKIVSKSRSLSAKKIADFEAGIFLGVEAENAGMADSVMSWDEFLATLTEKKVLAQRNNLVADYTEPRETPAMSLATLKNLVKKTEASIAAEKDAKKKKALSATLATYSAALEAYKKSKYVKETETKEEGGEEEDKEKGNKTDRREGGDGDGDDDKDEKDENDDEEEDEEEEEEDEEEEAKKSAASLATLARQATGKTGKAAVGALAAVLEQAKRTASMVDQITKERRAEKKGAAISAALLARRITKHEAKTLESKPLSFVSSFLEMRPKAIINVDDDTIRLPKLDAKAGDVDDIPSDTLKAIDSAASVAPDDKARAELRSKLIESHRARMNGSATTAGRY
jgi:signal peptide peptidase SppA